MLLLLGSLLHSRGSAAGSPSKCLIFEIPASRCGFVSGWRAMQVIVSSEWNYNLNLMSGCMSGIIFCPVSSFKTMRLLTCFCCLSGVDPLPRHRVSSGSQNYCFLFVCLFVCVFCVCVCLGWGFLLKCPSGMMWLGHIHPPSFALFLINALQHFHMLKSKLQSAHPKFQDSISSIVWAIC